MTLISIGETASVEPWLDAAERAPAPGPFFDGFGSGAAGAAYLRAMHRWQVGDVAGTRAAATAALAGDRDPSPWDAVTLTMLAGATYWGGEKEAGTALVREALAAGRAAGFVPPEISCLCMLAVIAREGGDAHAARIHAVAALDLVRDQGVEEYWVGGAAHSVLGQLALAEGRHDDARPMLERGLELARRGSGPLGVAGALIALALAVHAQGDQESALALLAEARALVEESPDPGPVTLASLADARRAVEGAAPQRRQLDEDFSGRELQVLRMLSGTLTQREIGQELFISFNTVKSHTKAIYRKLGAADRNDALARARELGLL